MSILPKETIEVIAQSVGINNLSVDAALTLAPDVEYRMRELMQEAIKCMRHSRRTILTTDDVDTALNIRNVEPVYGFASGDPLRFKRAVGHMDLFYIEDKDVDFKEIIEAPLPKAPLDTSIMCHWLAIEGVQPAIPENAPVQVIVRPDEKRSERKDDSLPIDIKVPVQHVLSRELQLYFDKITELTIRGSETVLFKEALVSLATDAGLHPLVPYFTCFIADEVARGLGDFSLLFALMRLVRSLLKNPHIQIEPYLHQLMPSVVSCLVAKRLGNRLADNHWELRDFTAKLVASICKRFGHAYGNLQPRLTRTLVNAFLDPKRAITQHYGAIQGLAALGPNVVSTLILPNLKPYLKLLEPEMLLESQKNEMKRHEAWRVYGALLHAAGQCIHDRLKKFPVLPSPPCHEVWGKKERVNTVPPGKRKTSMERSEEEQKASMERSEEEQKASMEHSEEEQKASMEINEKEQKASMEIDEEKQKASMEIDEEKQKASMEIDEEKQKASMEIDEEKQKASMECSEEEPPLKRVATDGPLLENNSSPGVKQNEVDAIASSSGASDLPSTSEQMAPATQKKSGRNDTNKNDKEVLKLSAVMNQVWKDDLNSGQVLVSMLELFGESIFPFIPAPELSLFV